LTKAPDAFRTISEVADELDLPQHVLRFWESRFPLIKPMKRGGGRRYYRPEDVDLLRGIRHLLYGDGYTIRGVQRILREQGVRTVQSVGQGHKVTLPAPSREDDAEPDSGRGILDMLPPRISDVAAPAAARDAPDDAEEHEAALPEIVPDQRPKGGARLSQAVLPLLPAKAAAAPPVAGISQDDLDRLKTALSELEVCRRLLDKAADGGR
jgi:DNA-binding transcriptional MerR regulator